MRLNVEGVRLYGDNDRQVAVSHVQQHRCPAQNREDGRPHHGRRQHQTNERPDWDRLEHIGRETQPQPQKHASEGDRLADPAG